MQNERETELKSKILYIGHRLMQKIQEKIGYQSKKFQEEFMEIWIRENLLKRKDLEQQQAEAEHLYFSIDDLPPDKLHRDLDRRVALCGVLESQKEEFRSLGIKVVNDEYRKAMTKEDALAAVSLYAGHYEFLPDRFKEDRDVALRTVEKDPWQMRHMSLRLRNDERIALAAVSREGETLGLVGPKQSQNSKVIDAAVRNDQDAENLLTPTQVAKNKEKKRPGISIYEQKTGRERQRDEK